MQDPVPRSHTGWLQESEVVTSPATLQAESQGHREGPFCKLQAAEGEHTLAADESLRGEKAAGLGVNIVVVNQSQSQGQAPEGAARDAALPTA